MAVLRLQDVGMRDVGMVGGKAASLGELLQTKQRVPKGFVITSAEHDMSAALKKEVLDFFDQLELDVVAVRSSGIEEDGTDKSWAGQFATLLNVSRDGLAQAIRDCWDSAKSARAAAYGQAASLAVLVQEMIQSEISGVAFSVDPISGDQSRIVIEAVYGLCEPLVSGTATPDHFALNKADGAMIEQDIAEKPTMLALEGGKNKLVPVSQKRQNESTLSQPQLTEVSALVRAVESHYGFPVDIEWAYEGNILYLLQARPITTL